MKQGFKNGCYGRARGFTLIELLVVVLIIGILSAVALPQYRVAVAKARYSRMMPVVRMLADSADRYYLENGGFPADEGELYLDMTYPEGCTNQNTNQASSCPDKYSYDIFDNNKRTVTGVDSRSLTGYIQWISASANPGARRCVAEKSNTAANSVCKSLGGTAISGETYYFANSKLGTVTVYALP